MAGWFATRAEVVRWGGRELPDPLTSGWLAREYARPGAYALTAPDGSLVGVFEVRFFLRERRAHLRRVALAPAERGRGLAAVLAEAAVEVASSQGAAEQMTLAVLASNTAARSAYARAGFREHARLRALDPADGVVRMIRDL